MYKKIRIVICFTLIFCLAIMAFSPASNAEIALTSAVIGGLSFAVFLGAGAYINSQNTVGSTIKDYFTGQVNKYITSVGSTISDLFGGQVDYTDGDIQCDTEMQTNINNFLSWWAGDTNQEADNPTTIIDNTYLNGVPITNQPAGNSSSAFPSAYYMQEGQYYTYLYVIYPDGRAIREKSVTNPGYKFADVTSFSWSLENRNGSNDYRYRIKFTFTNSNGSYNYEEVSNYFELSNDDTITQGTTTSTIPDDFEGTIVTFIPPPPGTPTGNGNNSSGKNNIGLSAAVTGATIAGIVDAIDALYDKVATSTTPVEIPIIIIEEVPEPTPPPSPSPTPSMPFIPDGFEDIFNNLKNSLQNAQDTIDDVKEAVDTVTETTTETKEAIDEITEGINAEPDTSIDYKVSLTRVFPFCIPFDIYRLSNAFIAEPVTPHIDYTFELPFLDFEYTLELDLSDFDGVASLLRSCEYIAFCIGLAIATSKVIKW